jgi:hypothetical protein
MVGSAISPLSFAKAHRKKLHTMNTGKRLKNKSIDGSTPRRRCLTHIPPSLPKYIFKDLFLFRGSNRWWWHYFILTSSKLEALVQTAKEFTVAAADRWGSKVYRSHLPWGGIRCHGGVELPVYRSLLLIPTIPRTWDWENATRKSTGVESSCRWIDYIWICSSMRKISPTE